jgi:hypothetical protein
MFVYGCVPNSATALQTNSTPATEFANMALRQATRGFDVLSILAGGRAAAATTLTGISFKARRWTTVGTGGGAIVPAPRRVGTTASTTAADSSSALTQGTVSGAYQVAFTCGGSTPGGWAAYNEDARIHVEAGSADEIAINSICGVASQNLELSADIAE